MTFTEVVNLAGALGAGLTSGLLFAFSVFIMRALGRMAPAEGARAMQYINEDIITPLFMLIFMGPVILSVVSITLSFLQAPRPLLSASAGLLYLLGTFGITLVKNVPLNNQLADCDPDDPTTEEVWRSYLKVWTKWNHYRTVCGILAAACWILA